MSSISKTQLIKDCADAYRAASGTSEPVRYDELADKIETLSGGGGGADTFTVAFTAEGTLHKKVIAKSGNGIYLPTVNPVSSDPTKAFCGWYLNSIYQEPDILHYYSGQVNVTALFESAVVDRIYQHLGIAKSDYPKLFIGVRLGWGGLRICVCQSASYQTSIYYDDIWCYGPGITYYYPAPVLREANYQSIMDIVLNSNPSTTTPFSDFDTIAVGTLKSEGAHDVLLFNDNTIQVLRYGVTTFFIV